MIKNTQKYYKKESVEYQESEAILVLLQTYFHSISFDYHRYDIVEEEKKEEKEEEIDIDKELDEVRSRFVKEA